MLFDGVFVGPMCRQGGSAHVTPVGELEQQP
jgi:hypothetical protein